MASVALAMPFPPISAAVRPPAETISQCSRKCTRLFATARKRLLATGAAACHIPAGDSGMLYAAYQAHSDMMAAVRAFAGMAAQFGSAGAGMPGYGAVRNVTAAYELIARAGLTHSRP